MSTTMRHLVASMSQGLFWLTLSLELWILLDLDRMGKFSDQITLFLDNPGQEITGPRDTTQRVYFEGFLRKVLTSE